MRQLSLFLVLILSFAVPTFGSSGSNIVGLNLVQNLKILEKSKKTDVVITERLNQKSKNLVFFWASWCDVCKSLLPQYDKDMSALSKCGFNIHYVTVRDEVEKTRAAELELKMTKKSLVDEKGFLNRTMGLRVLPTAVLVNSDGFVEEAFEGSSAVRASVEYFKKSKGKSCE